MKLLVLSDGAKPTAAFSLVELLLVLGILAIIFAAGGPVALNFYLDYQLDSETELLAALLRQSRNLAMINSNESNHGLYLGSGNFIIFQGASFAVRVQSKDRTFPRTEVISISGPAEQVFSALSGRTASTTYNVSDSRKTRDIYVNAEGLVY